MLFFKKNDTLNDSHKMQSHIAIDANAQKVYGRAYAHTRAHTHMGAPRYLNTYTWMHIYTYYSCACSIYIYAHNDTHA